MKKYGRRTQLRAQSELPVGIAERSSANGAGTELARLAATWTKKRESCPKDGFPFSQVGATGFEPATS
jgi:hypothetical protein